METTLLYSTLLYNFEIIVQLVKKTPYWYAVCVDFDTSMNIRYGGICETNADS
jgi:hypothetical protein